VILQLPVPCHRQRQASRYLAALRFL